MKTFHSIRLFIFIKEARYWNGNRKEQMQAKMGEEATTALPGSFPISNTENGGRKRCGDGPKVGLTHGVASFSPRLSPGGFFFVDGKCYLIQKKRAENRE